MDSNLLYFLFGLILSVPIGILVNLGTPKMQAWIINRPRISATRKLHSLQSELDEISRLHDNKEQMYLKALSTVFLVLLFIGTGNAASILASFAGVFGGLFSFQQDIHTIVFGFVLGMSLFLFMSAFISCLNFIRIISKVRNYDEYKLEIERQIEKIRSQGIVTSLSKALVLESARYGANDKFLDVTEIIKKKIADGKLEVTVSNTLKGDPIQGVPKELIISYYYDGTRYTKTVPEGEMLELP